jgi:hypothetical protein
MHFVLSYDIHATGDNRTRIEESINQIITQFSWVKPLTTTFIIQVNGQLEWNNIQESLSNLSRNNQGSINFLMTPLMQGGRYNGWLNQDLWNEINRRSN